MNNDDVTGHYGIESKSVQQLIEDFAVELMYQHNIFVKGITFSKEGLERVTQNMQLSAGLPPQPLEVGVSIIKTYTAAGKIELGSEE